MLFSSLRNLPSPPLGLTFYEWQVKPFWRQRLFWLAMFAALVGLLAWIYFYGGKDLKFLQRYIEILFYMALPVLSMILPRLILSWKTRFFEFRDYGLVIHYGKPDQQQPGAGWAYWKDYDRVELGETTVNLFPKKPLLRALKLPCPDNRLTIYAYASEKIAQFRYRPLPDEDSHESELEI